MSRIFISHSGAEIGWALALHDWLAREGLSDETFLDLDPSPDPAGERWIAALETAAARCEIVLFLVSEAWLSSRWSPKEFRFASLLHKAVFALLIEDISLAKLPEQLTYRNLINLCGDPSKRVTVVHPGTHEPYTVEVSTDGLAILKRELEKFGLLTGGSAPIFVSFSSRDQKEALEIVDRLEAASIKCWISCRDVPHGDDYQDAIVTALETVKAMVLIFSKHADSSKEIKKELALASENGLFVLPVRIDDTKPTKGFRYQLATRQYIDLFPTRENNMQLVIDALRRHLASTP